MLRKVAITGGLSCGKSSVCRFLKEQGAYVISADAVVHQHLTPLTKLGQEVISLLGPDIVDGSKINRSKIALKVFHDPKLLRKLEQLTHPVVKVEMESLYEKVSKKNQYPLFVVEIPLLFEAGWSDWFDVSVSVYADPAYCKARFVEQGHTEQEYDERMKFQIDPKEKVRLADYVIENNGSLDDLKKQTFNLFKTLTQPMES